MLLGLAAQYAAKPDKIDPQKVYDMATSPYNKEIYDRSNDLIDQDSEINRQVFDRMNTAAQDNTYVSNRIAKMNMNKSGIGGQSGILNELMNQNNLDSGVGLLKNYQNYVQGNLGASNNLLTTATSNDMQARQPMVDAYGTNITNKNNWMASMAGNVMKTTGGGGDMMGAENATQLAGMILCDANMKENIKRIGTAKAKNGKVGIYKYNYKGQKNTKTGIIAQDVQRSHPKAVHKGKNGKLYVKLGEVFS